MNPANSSPFRVGADGNPFRVNRRPLPDFTTSAAPVAPPVLSLAPPPVQRRDDSTSTTIGLLGALGAILGGRADLAGGFGAAGMEGFRKGEDNRFAQDSERYNQERQNTIAQNSDAWRAVQWNQGQEQQALANRRYDAEQARRASREAIDDNRFAQAQAHTRERDAVMDNRFAQQQQQYQDRLALEDKRYTENRASAEARTQAEIAARAQAAKQEQEFKTSQESKQAVIKTNTAALDYLNGLVKDPRTPASVQKEISKRMKIVAEAQAKGVAAPAWVFQVNTPRLPMSPEQQATLSQRNREFDANLKEKQADRAQRATQFEQRMTVQQIDKLLDDSGKGGKPMTANQFFDAKRSLDAMEMRVQSEVGAGKLTQEEGDAWLGRLSQRRRELEQLGGTPVTLPGKKMPTLGATPKPSATPKPAGKRDFSKMSNEELLRVMAGGK